MRLKASAFSGAGALSTTTTVPPGRQTRAICFSTAPGSRKWWNAKRDVTIENDASGYGSGSTSPCCHVTFVTPCSVAYAWARSSIAGVRSMPVACFTTRANATTMSPGPDATSSTVSSGPAPLSSTTSFSAASSLIDGAVAKCTAWCVNWSRMMSECLLEDMAALHDDFQVVELLEHPEILERVAVHDDEISVLAGLDGADLVGHAEELGVDLGR